jgi:hypothetical protein
VSREALEQLMDRWINDSAFREEFRSDPEAAVRKSGLSLSPDEWNDVRAMDVQPADEELQPRVSRS